MKNFIISTFILLIPALGLLSALAGTEQKTSETQQQQQLQQLLYPDNPDQSQTVPRTPTTIARTDMEEQLIADPNKIIAKIKEFEGLQEELDKVDDESRDEEQAWLQTRTDNRLNLARSVKKQVATELIFLRKLAEQEKAEKTLAAIDGLLLKRHERFESITEKLEEQKREQRQQQDQRRRAYNPRQRGRVPRSRMPREDQQGQAGY